MKNLILFGLVVALFAFVGQTCHADVMAPLEYGRAGSAFTVEPVAGCVASWPVVCEKIVERRKRHPCGGSCHAVFRYAARPRITIVEPCRPRQSVERCTGYGFVRDREVMLKAPPVRLE